MNVEEIYRTVKERREWINQLKVSKEDEKTKQARISELDEILWLIEDSI